MKLRDYQQRAIDELRAAYASGKKAPVLIMPTGAGKTPTAAAIIASARARSRRVILLAGRLELLDQAARKLADAGVTDVRVIQAENDSAPDAAVIVASVQTLASKKWQGNLPPADLAVIDECFPAGAQVDGRPIESLRVGDLVQSFNHEVGAVEMRAVRRLFCSRPKALVTVHFDDGRSITCTAGHPFFTGDGYTAALELRPGDPVYGENLHLRGMRSDLRAPGMDEVDGREPSVQRGMQEGATRKTRKESCDNVCDLRNRDRALGASGLAASAKRTRVLLDGVQQGVPTESLGGDPGGNEPSLRFCATESDQSDALRGDSRACERRAQSDGASPTDSGRQRARARADGDAVAQRASAGLDAEPRRADEHAAQYWLSRQLQAGPCVSRDEDRDRGGRIEPLRSREQGKGCEEAGLSRVARVDRVEVHERRGSDGFGALCPNDLVYNVEVDGNHNYFVDGVLVHNCHHVAAKTWAEIARFYPVRLGLTATPERGDGSALSDMFDAIVVGSTVSELTALGHLVPCRVYAPPAIMSPRELAMEPVDAYQRYAAGTKSVVFAVTVKHAEKLAAEFRARGIGAEHVAGDMSSRPDVIARHARGEFPVLVNVSLVVEGYDDPALASAIFAKRFTHVGGYLQAIGRTLRPHASKTGAVVVDLCGSALVHGTPDVEREYSLTGKAISKADRLAIRQCAACGGVSTGRPACPYCSSQFPIATRGIPQAGDIGVDELPRTKPTSWPMRAKKMGVCAGCRGQILPGTWIVYSSVRRLAVHTACSGEWARRAA